jgi:hypothetical protein
VPRARHRSSCRRRRSVDQGLRTTLSARVRGSARRCRETGGEPAVQGGPHRAGLHRRQQGGVDVGAVPAAGALGDRCGQHPLRFAEPGDQPGHQGGVCVDDLHPQRPQLRLLCHLRRHLPVDGPDRRDRRLVRRPGGELLGQVLRRGGVQSDDGVVLRGEVVEERPRRDVGAGGDVVDRHSVQPALRDQSQGGLVQREPGGELLALAQPRRGRRGDRGGHGRHSC